MNVLVVDDSVVYRHGITKAIEGIEGMTVVGAAINGRLAIDKFNYLKPDVVTMDLEMPEMDGIETIKALRKISSDVKIIVFSDVSEAGAVKTLQALQAGANDFLPKSVVKEDSDSIVGIRREIEPRLRQFMSIGFQKERQSSTTVPRLPKVKDIQADLIVIGSSTGGPELLRRIFSNLKGYCGPAILICQHMPPVFTGQLAKMLETNSGISVAEAQQGMRVEAGKAYIAPGGYHMTVQINEKKEYTLALDQNEKVKSVRPSVDVLFQSVAKRFTGRVAAFVLTGMGDDGVDGVRELKSSRNTIIIQDEGSSVVWGMPGAVARDQLQDYVVDAGELSQIILNIKGGKRL